MSETFEAMSGPLSGASIMGGNASLASDYSIIVGYDGLLGLGNSGPARSSDGWHMMAMNDGLWINHPNPSFVIHFREPVFAFGAFFGRCTGGDLFADPAQISFQFFDSAGDVLGTETVLYSHSAVGDGELDWHGWVSTQNIASISISGDGLVMDGMQAIPEPAGLSLGVFAVILYFGRSPVIQVRATGC